MLGNPRVPLDAVMKPYDLRCELRSEPLAVDSSHPRLSWLFENKGNAQGQTQTEYRIIVASSRDLLARNHGDLWDSGTIKSSDQNNIPYNGKDLQEDQICYWKVAITDGNGKTTWSSPAKWERGVTAWKAKWIEDGKPASSDQDLYENNPAPLLRKEFTAQSQIARARLHIAGLGYYEAHLNGKKIGDHVLDPGWTRYEKQVEYSTYDVTKQLKSGENCLGVILGNGWFNPLPLKLFGQFNLRDHLTVGTPRVIAELRIEYRDGSCEVISTDKTWKVGDSHILRNDLYLGEVVDARREQKGWSQPQFDDSSWWQAKLSGNTEGKLVAQHQPPIRVTETWKAVAVTQPKPGVFIYDMGVNFAGWASFKLNLPTGTRLVMRYGELLHKDGTLNPMTSVAGQIKRSGAGGPGAPDIAWQTDTYIAKGGGETYTPRFTFHGFRYVEIAGLEKPLPLDAVTAMRLNSGVETVGSFECSNPLLNDIQTMCLRTFKSNIFSVQSDCPHRERLGYGGDIVATSEAFMANYDMSGFYAKAVRDWSDSARPDGMFTDTAPFMGIQYCGVIWAMAHPLLVNQLGQYYGDQRISEEEYQAARRWLSIVDNQYPDGIVMEGLSDHESLTANPSPELVTPMYFQTINLMEEMAKRLGKFDDAELYRQFADKVQKAYLLRFFDNVSGKVGPGTQTSQSMALYTNIVPKNARAQVLQFLLEDIRKNNGKLTTGILGTKFMLQVLSQEGHADIAYQIVTQPAFPGWNWMLKNGATTLWEHWEFSDNTFSHNHPMFGSVSQWMMQCLGGIRPAANAVGFNQIILQPQTPKDLDWVKSSYQSVRGKIVSNWKRDGANLVFEIEVPPNTSATVTLPKGNTTKNGKSLIRDLDSSGSFAIGSGRYVFIVKAE